MVPEKLIVEIEQFSSKRLKTIIDQLNKDMTLAGFQLNDNHENFKSLFLDHSRILDQLLSGNGNISAYLYRLDVSENHVQNSLKSSDPISALSKLCISRAYLKIKLREELSQ
jgi:hypothetical protein